MSRLLTASSSVTVLLVGMLAFVPTTLAAAGEVDISRLEAYAAGIRGIINGVLMPVLMAIAFIVFIWGVYKYFILGAADEKSRADGRQFVLSGVIGFAIILSMWGLVNIVVYTFGLVDQAPTPPTL